MSDVDSPDVTVDGPSNGQPVSISELRFRVEGKAARELLCEEFRFADSWHGLFETAEAVVE